MRHAKNRALIVAVRNLARRIEMMAWSRKALRNVRKAQIAQGFPHLEVGLRFFANSRTSQTGWPALRRAMTLRFGRGISLYFANFAKASPTRGITSFQSFPAQWDPKLGIHVT